MPREPIPPELDAFLAEPNMAVIGTLAGDGSPHTAATWYAWEDGRVYVNMEDTRRRLKHLRDDPRVSITVMGADEWYRQVTLRGRVASIEDDPQLEGVDRLARRYTGDAYPRGGGGRVGAWIEVESWYGWAGGQPWSGSD